MSDVGLSIAQCIFETSQVLLADVRVRFTQRNIGSSIFARSTDWNSCTVGVSYKAPVK